VKHSENDPINRFRQLLKKYAPALDLISSDSDEHIASLIDTSKAFAERLALLSPTPGTVMDLGSGAGLPGIPVAIMRPEIQVLLVERRRRRAAFLRLVVGNLGLHNASVFPGDVTILSSRSDVGAVTTLAVASLKRSYCLTRHTHAPIVHLLSIKGAALNRELLEMEASLGSKPLLLEVIPSTHGRLISATYPGGLPCL